MFVTSYTTAQGFLAQTQDALLTKEATNSLILGISFRLKSRPDQFLTEPFLATVNGQARTHYCRMHDPSASPDTL